MRTVLSPSKGNPEAPAGSDPGFLAWGLTPVWTPVFVRHGIAASPYRRSSR
jgi:hypothetical protein